MLNPRRKFFISCLFNHFNGYYMYLDISTALKSGFFLIIISNYSRLSFMIRTSFTQRSSFFCVIASSIPVSLLWTAPLSIAAISITWPRAMTGTLFRATFVFWSGALTTLTRFGSRASSMRSSFFWTWPENNESLVILMLNVKRLIRA